jgi:hypothetical protein
MALYQSSRARCIVITSLRQGYQEESFGGVATVRLQRAFAAKGASAELELFGWKNSEALLCCSTTNCLLWSSAAMECCREALMRCSEAVAYHVGPKDLQ